MLADGRAATAGQDARIALWTPGKQDPDRVLEGHQGPIVALAISPDGATLASASWDRTIRLWPLAGGAPQVLEGHQQSVNGVAFTPDGTAIVSAGYDATVHIWRLNEPTSPPVVPLPTPLNAVTVSPEGDIIAAGSDGMVYFLSPAENQRDALRASSTPVTSLAISRNGEFIAAASIGGEVTIIDRRTRRVARSLAGPGLPVWSVAFLLDNHTLLTGGADRIIPAGISRPASRPAPSRPAGPRIRSPSMPATRAPTCFVVVSPAIRSSRMRATAPARPCTAFSDVGSPASPVTISPWRSGSSTLCGRHKRWRGCSRSGRRTIPRGPRCRSNASARRKTVTRWSGFSNARPSDHCSRPSSRSRK